MERVPEITFEESCRQIERIRRRAQKSQEAGDFASALHDLHRLLEHHCAHHQVVAYEVWDEIFELHRQAGEYDAAIEAKRRAVALGYRSIPDPEADVAECHLLAGRRSEANELFTQLRDAKPDDVWLYNAAGFAYALAGADDLAARWFQEGIQVALRGDPDQVVYQLLEGLEDATEKLGQEIEPDIRARVEEFVKTWRPVSLPVGDWDDLPTDEDRPCAHCGYDPDRSWAQLDERRRRQRRQALAEEMPDTLARLDGIRSVEQLQRGPTSLEAPVSLSVAWFPSDEWTEAVGRWPDLLEEMPADHGEYSHRIEARIKQIARHAQGHPMHVAAITVQGLAAHGEEHDQDPGTAEARSSYAAELNRAGQAQRWPPGRNMPCWCGSGRKYKVCCGPVPAAVDEPSEPS